MPSASGSAARTTPAREVRRKVVRSFVFIGQPRPPVSPCSCFSVSPSVASSCGPSLTHRDDDGIAPEAQDQPFALGLQVQDHARFVLHPEIAGARRADRKAVSGLAIGAGELRQVTEVVHLALRIDRGKPDAAHAYAADLERILLAAEEQCAGAYAAASDVRRLHLLQVDGAVRRLALDRLRSERDVPGASG